MAAAAAGEHIQEASSTSGRPGLEWHCSLAGQEPWLLQLLSAEGRPLAALRATGVVAQVSPA